MMAKPINKKSRIALSNDPVFNNVKYYLYLYINALSVIFDMGALFGILLPLKKNPGP